MLRRELERRAVAGGEQIFFAAAAAAPDRADGVDDMPGRQPVAARDLGGAGRAAAEGLARRKQFRPGGAMDGTVYTAATQQRRVGGVDDGIDGERGDVGDNNFQPRSADIGAK